MKRKRLAAWLGVCFACVRFGSGASAEDLPHVDVFVSGSGGYHTYRIPSLLVTGKGTLLAFCEGRKTDRGDHGDLDLMLRRSTDGGKSWSKQQIVYEEGGDEKITIGNPCPVLDERTGRVWLPFCRDNDDVLITYSDDDGKTWATPRDITESVKMPSWGWYATGPGVGIQLQVGKHKGRLVIPCDHREPHEGKTAKFSHVFYSDDGGQSWQLGGSVSPHTDECQVVELPDGRLLINTRNYWQREGGVAERGGKRAVATSSDGGATWSELSFDDQLIEPVCQAGMIAYQREQGRQLLIFINPASTKSRVRMTVRVSQDDGQSWPISKLVYAGSAAYSCPTQLPDGRIGLLYERDNYRRIAFTSFGLGWLGVEDE